MIFVALRSPEKVLEPHFLGHGGEILQDCANFPTLWSVKLNARGVLMGKFLFERHSAQ